MRTITGRMKAGHWALSRDEYEAVCEVLDAGKLIVYPTDTLYGLGCDPFEVPAVDGPNPQGGPPPRHVRGGRAPARRDRGPVHRRRPHPPRQGVHNRERERGVAKRH